MAVDPAQRATSTLIEHVHATDVARLPAAVVEQAKVLLADEIGILLAASQERTVRTVLATFPLSNGPSTVVGHGKGATPEQAALVNGCGGHDIELDDSHSPSRTHAASVLVPAALAAAEVAGGSTGAEMLAALIAGYDVQVRMSKALGVQAQFDHYFHPTSVCGSVGAAVVAGKILGLSTAQMHACLTLACSQSSGGLTWHDDSTHMVKSFQPGIASRNGLTAAMLAQNGFQGIDEVFTSRYSPLLQFGLAEPEYGELVDALGVRYDICETSIKRHACGGQTHSALDALLTIQAEQGIDAGDIATIDAELAHNAVPIIDNNPLLIANIQYVLALAAHVGLVRREHFSDEWTTNVDILRLKERVTVRGNDELQSRFPAMKGAIVTVVARGQTYRQQYDSPPGSPFRPLSINEIRGKFVGLAAAVLADVQVDELWQLLADFEAVEDTTRFFEILGSSPQTAK